MSERTVREQMRYAFGPQVADHIAALTQIISETLVPAMRDNAKRIAELEAKVKALEGTDVES